MATAPDPRLAVRIVAVPGKGRGVVAARPIEDGELVDDAPVVVIPARQWPLVSETALSHYCFEWDEDTGSYALVLGRPSLFNHSYDPNVVCEKVVSGRRMRFVARRAIATGEELTINYHGEPTATGPLWFDVRP